MLLVVVALSADNYADPDLWRHLLVGRIVLATGPLPLRDTFSYTAFGHLWRQHEWLAQAIMALCYNAAGVFGLKLLKLACAAATVSLLAIGIAETGASARIQRSIMILIALALAPQMQFRPQLFTYVLLSLLFALEAAESYRGSSRLWIAIPAFALWANLHGGFVVGLGALCGFTGILAITDFWRGAGFSRGARLSAIAAACGAATLVNPIGIGVWSNALHSITDSYVKAAIVEWRPLTSMLADQLRSWSPGAVIYLVPIAIFAALAVCVAITPAADDLAMVIVAAVFAAGAFYAVRNMALAVIATAIPLARHAGLVARLREARSGNLNRDSDQDRGFNPALAVVLAVAMAWFGGLLSDRLKLGLDYPVAAVEFIKEHHLRGNVLCDFSWGEYLMWHLGGQNRVFIDGRWELVYPHEIMRDYVHFEQARPDAERVLDSYPNDLVLLSPRSKASRVVMNDPNWKLIYGDRIALLYARSYSPMARRSAPAGGASVEYFP